LISSKRHALSFHSDVGQLRKCIAIRARDEDGQGDPNVFGVPAKGLIHGRGRGALNGQVRVGERNLDGRTLPSRFLLSSVPDR